MVDSNVPNLLNILKKKKLLKNKLRVEHYLLYSIFPFSAQKASSCDRQRATPAVPPSLDEHIEIPSGAGHFSNDG